MNIYVLLRSMVGDDLTIVGIFSSEEKAMDAKRIMESNAKFFDWEFWITNKILDPCVCMPCV